MLARTAKRREKLCLHRPSEGRSQVMHAAGMNGEQLRSNQIPTGSCDTDSRQRGNPEIKSDADRFG
eukprot:1138197-Pleurochrysis_carterae.AAC.1